MLTLATSITHGLSTGDEVLIVFIAILIGASMLAHFMWHLRYAERREMYRIRLWIHSFFLIAMLGLILFIYISAHGGVNHLIKS